MLIYKARAYIALNQPSRALALVPDDTKNVALRALHTLARFVEATEELDQQTVLEEFSDLCVEIEGDDGSIDDKDKWLVRVLAGTAFAGAGEIEEALDSLGAGSNTQNLEAYVPSPTEFH